MVLMLNFPIANLPDFFFFGSISSVNISISVTLNVLSFFPTLN